MVRRLAAENRDLKAQNKRLAKQAKAKILSTSKNCTLRNKINGLVGIVNELTIFFTKEINYWADVPISLPKTRRYLADKAAFNH